MGRRQIRFKFHLNLKQLYDLNCLSLLTHLFEYFVVVNSKTVIFSSQMLLFTTSTLLHNKLLHQLEWILQVRQTLCQGLTPCLFLSHYYYLHLQLDFLLLIQILYHLLFQYWLSHFVNFLVRLACFQRF